MKKALIPALLIACAALAPHLSRAVDFPCPNFRITAALASPVFWNLWDALLSKAIAQVTGEATELAASPNTLCDSFAPLASGILLGRGLEVVRFPEPKAAGSDVSISLFFVRRIVERELAIVREGSARHRRSRQNRG